MQTKFLGLRTLGVQVPDLAAAKAWYTKILGIEPYFDEPFYVGFNVAGYELGLQPAEEAITPGNSSTTYWGVVDAHESFKELLAQGATAHEEPSEVGGGIIVAAVKDPWGNVFGIIYNPHFTLGA